MGFDRRFRSDVCEYCGLPEHITAHKSRRWAHEADEVRERSLTRGQPAELRFSVENTARACGHCHSLKTSHEIDIVYRTEHGMQGDYEGVRDGERAGEIGDSRSQAGVVETHS